MASDSESFSEPLQRVLGILSGRDDGRSIAAADWSALLTTAGAHGVLPLFAQRVLSAGSHDTLPHEIRTQLAATQQETVHRNAKRLHDFAAAASALQARGVPVIAMKGIHLVPLVYRNLAARTMIDIDVLVPVAHLTAAREAMEELGYQPMSPFRISAGPLPFSAHHLPAFLKPGSTTIEVHWHIFVPPPPEPIFDELWTRAVPARIGGAGARVLSTEDLLLHLAMHAMYGHRCEITLRACCDIAEVVRTQTVNWNDVLEGAVRWKTGPGTYLVFRLAQELLGARIPGDVLAALEPRDFDPQLLRIALRGVVDHRRAARLRYVGGTVAKLRTIKEHVFIKREKIADIYNVPRSSPVVYGLYLLRGARLLTRLREALAAHRSDGRAAAESAAIDTFLRRESSGG